MLGRLAAFGKFGKRFDGLKVTEKGRRGLFQKSYRGFLSGKV
jgi:hypothetical protein